MGKLKPCQQLKEYDAVRMVYPIIGQIKMDGIFGQYEHGAFRTRAGNRIQGLQHLEDTLKDIKVSLDGELVIPGMNFFKMNGLIRSHNATPECRFYVFDSKSYKNQDYLARVTTLKPMIENLWDQKIRFLTSHEVRSEVEADILSDRAIAAGHEGVVYKSLNHPYYDGKKWHMMKRVPWKSCECTVIGSFEGKGHLTGRLGGFIVDFNGVPVRVGGGLGLTREIRKRLWEHRDVYLGSPLTCRYKTLTNKGSMRSPQMVGVRWDI